MSAAPIPDPVAERARSRVLLDGDLPSPAEKIDGCRFRTRCPLYKLLDEQAQARCIGEDPKLEPHDGVAVACHWVERNTLVVG
jgi:peptide/nickel transport system ATP-binding protein